MALISTQVPLHHGSPRCSDGAPDSTTTELAGRSDCVKLGDFARLRSLSNSLLTPSKMDSSMPHNSDSLGFMTPPISISRDQPNKALALGDFSKLFDRLSPSAPVSPSQPAAPSFSAKTYPVEILKRPSSPRPILNVSPVKKSAKKSASPKRNPSKKVYSDFDPTSSSGTGSSSESDREPNSPYSTPASSPSTSVGRDASPLAKFSKNKASPRTSKSAKPTPNATTQRSAVQPKPRNQAQTVLFYQPYNHGPITAVYDELVTEEAKHNSLAYKLVPERVVDKILAVENSNLETNGIHVFIDMSNISISFQKALRGRYSLPDSVRFTPLPSMNLSFLHELLVRDRKTRVLNAGCSMRPDRAEPIYIQELRDLGYRVDLRYRRREGEQSPEEVRGSSGHSRYVEDMVDETLQTRIGESVMQYFGEPGTLVLATGDARPAKFSDGFFTYADRALKMGWNVEVVSWKSSLSGAWTNRAWAEPWGDRFRVIELDGFLDDIFACYTS